MTFLTTTIEQTPSDFSDRGRDGTVRYAGGQSWLGQILVASTAAGICAILIGDDPDALARDLRTRFPKARLVRGGAELDRLTAEVASFVAAPARGLDLRLDPRGTEFQRAVWQALREIPTGSTASYTEIAERIGRPGSVRAVAQACAANPIAVATRNGLGAAGASAKA